MSRGFIKEGDQEAIPMVPPRAYLPEGVPNYVTKEGLAALNGELESLKAELAKVGDNYIMGNFIEAKMKLLIDRISSAVEVDLSKANKGIVSFGAWIRYNGRVVRIVGVDEADVNKGLLSFTSPLAKSLMGKKAGDVIELKGSERITVEEVSFEPMELTRMVSDKPSSSSLPPQGSVSPSGLRAERSSPLVIDSSGGLLRHSVPRNDVIFVLCRLICQLHKIKKIVCCHTAWKIIDKVHSLNIFNRQRELVYCQIQILKTGWKR